MRRQSFQLLLTLALSVGTAAVAHSQPNGTNEKADTLFRHGNDAYNHEKWSDARDAYARAFELKRAHDIAANLAYSEMKLADAAVPEARVRLLRDAAEHLAFAVKNWPPTAKEDKKRYAVERFAVVKQEVVALTIQVNIPGAQVFVDDKAVGLSPLDLDVFVLPGTHAVRATRESYKDANQAVENAAKGTTKTIAFTMTPLMPSDVVPTATPSVSASAPPPVPSASTAPIAPPSTGGPSTALLVTGGLLTLGAVGAGVALMVVSSGKKSDAQQQSTALVQQRGPAPCQGTFVGDATCASIQGMYSSSDSLQTGAIVAFVGAGAVGAATLSYLLLAKGSTRESAVRIIPTFGASQRGVLVQGAF